MKYVDIGHGTPDAIIWLYRRGRIETASSKRTHAKVWGNGAMKYWRGRFDPASNRCSVVPPESWVGDMVPTALPDALEQKFGTGVEIVSFNPPSDEGVVWERREKR